MDMEMMLGYINIMDTSNDKYNDEVVSADMRKLVRLAKSLARYSNGFIIEIYISPDTVIIEGMNKDVKVDFMFIYNINALKENENLNQTQEYYSMAWRNYINGEFHIDIDVNRIVYAYGYSTKIPMLCLYSVFEECDTAAISEEDKKVINELLSYGMKVSIPNSFPYVPYKLMILHNTDIGRRFIDYKRSKDAIYKNVVISGKDVKNADGCYTARLLTSNLPIKHNIPYTFITEKFELQEDVQELENN